MQAFFEKICLVPIPISHTGVWNVIQALGEKLEKDEKELVETNKHEQIKGEKEVPVLFEEADGVWLNLQGKDRKKRHFPKAAMMCRCDS